MDKIVFVPPNKVAEINLAGSALTLSTLNMIEELLRPLAQVLEQIDIHITNVSVAHLNEARRNHQLSLADRYHQSARAVIKNRATGEVLIETPWFFTADADVKLEYQDDTTRNPAHD